MKLIKNSLFIATTVLSGIIFTTSCKPNQCSTVLCVQGECDETDGSCTCQPGYEGSRCETVTRSKFKGSWNVVEDGTATNPTSYTLSVQDGAEIDKVIIKNFNNFANNNVVATVKEDTIYIGKQNITQSGINKDVEGKGYFIQENFYPLHGKLVLKYKVTDAEGNSNFYGYEGKGNASEWTK